MKKPIRVSENPEGSTPEHKSFVRGLQRLVSDHTDNSKPHHAYFIAVYCPSTNEFTTMGNTNHAATLTMLNWAAEDYLGDHNIDEIPEVKH